MTYQHWRTPNSESSRSNSPLIVAVLNISPAAQHCSRRTPASRPPPPCPLRSPPLSLRQTTSSPPSPSVLTQLTRIRSSQPTAATSPTIPTTPQSSPHPAPIPPRARIYPFLPTIMTPPRPSPTKSMLHRALRMRTTTRAATTHPMRPPHAQPTQLPVALSCAAPSLVGVRLNPSLPSLSASVPRPTRLRPRRGV